MGALLGEVERAVTREVGALAGEAERRHESGDDQPRSTRSSHASLYAQAGHTLPAVRKQVRASRTLQNAAIGEDGA
jgi:hypothetical protein